MAFAIQPDDYSCGPTCIFNALRLLGNADISIGRIKKACGTRPASGTTENGLQRGLRRLGYEGIVANWDHKSHGRKALAWVRQKHSEGQPVILCVDRFEHWILVAGSKSRSYFVLDPESGSSRRAKVYRVSGTELLRRWWSFDRASGIGSYYAMAVNPRTQKSQRLAHKALPLTNPEVLDRLRESSNDLLNVSKALVSRFGDVKNGKSVSDLLAKKIAPLLKNRKYESEWAGLDHAALYQQLQNFLAFAKGRKLHYRPRHREKALIDLTILILLHTHAQSRQQQMVM
ncbi:hypothetical protein KJ068_16070 [bacterium]|nr:MAG: hypothetical protein EDS67_05750 [candidate division KSB1 bacterium]MCE7940355.1 hypothetical protein [Chlorobi bacterium CHB1]MCL4706688.1 hypothetical protein [bacterium]MDL1875620.1 hypothetical protein [Cytophagia bacterium CHB2]MBC6952217.1 hypothetical protein [candidate division KSB1 bacterium]